MKKGSVVKIIKSGKIGKVFSWKKELCKGLVVLPNGELITVKKEQIKTIM